MMLRTDGQRAVLMVLVACLVALVVAQAFVGSRTFRADPPNLGDQPGWDPVPVTVYDATGLVAEVRVWTRPEDWGGDPPLEGAVTLPDSWVRVGWIGGACADRSLLAFVDGGPGLRMAWWEQGLFLGCPAVGIPRAIEVRLTRLIEPDRIEVVPG